ncbi:MAG: polysaccharide deacetylase family protein [Pelagibacterales bacterium]|jgi:peptidoglycan/xylan/chitin deacetylase (PgdA/CDA1 family)|nr:polysaccharide deacetylase family protein [Pelagibacterales bacterium]
MKDIFIRIVFFTAYHLGVIRLFYYLTRKRQRVITYHNIIPDKYYNNSLEQGVSCSESVFKIQLKEIAKRFSFTTEVDKANTCMITFDDGYKNNYDVAIPILALYDIKAVFFITYNLVNKNETLWIDLIMKWCSYVPEGSYNILARDLSILDENRMKYFSSIFSDIYKNYKLKDEVIIALNKAYDFNNLILDEYYNKLRFSPISLQDIEKIKQDQHIIACHTISHDILSQLSNDLLINEIKESEQYIGELYNTNYFAYPFGGISEVSEKVLKAYSESKFSKCFVNYWNFFGFSSFNDECLQRLSLPNTANKYIIHAYLSGFYFFFKNRKAYV